MKKLIFLLFILLSAFPVSAKELCRNADTGLSLHEDRGVYSISGRRGKLILGDLKSARNLLASLEKSFIKENLRNSIDVGNQKYEIQEDKDGYYIISSGLKIRHSDITQFLVWLESRVIKDKASRIWDIIME